MMLGSSHCLFQNHALQLGQISATTFYSDGLSWYRRSLRPENFLCEWRSPTGLINEFLGLVPMTPILSSPEAPKTCLWGGYADRLGNAWSNRVGLNHLQPQCEVLWDAFQSFEQGSLHPGQL